MLCDSDEHGLVVRGRVDRRNLVRARGETAGDHSAENAVFRDIVETLEKVELRRVGGRSARERVYRLDDDVRVAINQVVATERLRGGEEVRVRVDEKAGVDVLDRELHCEVRVRLDRVEVLREDELRGGHGGGGGDHAHRRAVARAGLDLRAVRQGEVRCRAEVDEVVVGGG